ncbi:protein of unknown function [Methylocella tundrae]|uniref:Uncharacterized protein n=1 Tax=Methylocella tundrae TaxID=227605 RepID=A0A4U8YUQ0_METTU|nr:protein of unknown function [Methylocella tundrae]
MQNLWTKSLKLDKSSYASLWR